MKQNLIVSRILYSGLFKHDLNRLSWIEYEVRDEIDHIRNITIMFIFRVKDSFAARILPLSGRAKQGRFNGKERAANESFARKMNIITIITYFCEFSSTLLDAL